MKIISKFYDYYDSAQCHTFCKGSEAIYFRKTKEFKIEMPSMLWDFKRKYQKNLNKERLPEKIPHLIGFCGKFYFMYEVQIDSSMVPSFGYTNPYSLFCYDSKNYILEIFKDRYIRKNFKYFLKVWNSKKQEREEFTKEFVRRAKLREAYLLNHTPEINEYFLKYKTPVFQISKRKTYHKWTVTINPILKDLGFFKIMPASIAYQEIEMFFNSVLVEHEDPLQITDSKILLEAKGFDKRISFRHRK